MLTRNANCQSSNLDKITHFENLSSPDGKYFRFFCSCGEVNLQMWLRVLLEFTILSVVMAYNSREWKHLKCVRSLSALTDPNINIWRELNLETPEIFIKIKCHHNGGEGGSITTYGALEPVPYSVWWVGDETSEEGDSRALRSRRSGVNRSYFTNQIKK